MKKLMPSWHGGSGYIIVRSPEYIRTHKLMQLETRLMEAFNNLKKEQKNEHS
jgi:hypothetical protein